MKFYFRKVLGVKKIVLMIRSFVVILTVLFSFFNVTGQQKIENKLEATFYDYKSVSLDIDKIHSEMNRNEFIYLTLENPFEKASFWKMELVNSGIISDHYIARRSDGTVVNSSRVIPTKGMLMDDSQSKVYMTFDRDFIHGSIKVGGEEYFIEPMRFFDRTADVDDFLIYKKSDLKPEREATCGADLVDRRTEEHEEHVHLRTPLDGECYEVEWAIANDFDMFEEYNTAAAVEDHAISIANLVQGNYDDEFPDEIQFLISEQFTVTSAAQDPWTNNAAAEVLLSNFANWAGSGFSQDHDIGSLWTGRDLAGSTVGIAYVGVVCESVRYNVLSDFTANSDGKRVMVSHEIGHNFDATHDAAGSGFIMAPSVNFSNDWSDASIGDMQSHYLSRWCLDQCVSNLQPPVASFEYEVIEQCVEGEVQFNNFSSGSNLSFEWSFPGGTPSSSSEENPLVTYFDSGIYDATLIVSNSAGEDEITVFEEIEIAAEPYVEFTVTVDESTVDITNLSENLTFYEFDFGDGTVLLEENPSHIYSSDGTYTITLFGENACGSGVFSIVVDIVTTPEANFSSSNNTGCLPHTVDFNNLSTDNYDNIQWTFEGGTPAISTDDNPSISYTMAGSYDVTLSLSNEQGSDQITLEDYVIISDVRDADFSFAYQNNTTVAFTDESDDGLGGYSWDFGDGNSSTDQNPVHTYASPGEYTVSFSKSNECGDAEHIETVVISTAPVASFTYDQNGQGCAPVTIQFADESINNPTSYSWSFPGGNPVTSTEASPSVTYAVPGIYDVSLTVSNELGSNTITQEDAITVNTIPEGQASYMLDGNILMLFADYPEEYEFTWLCGTNDNPNVYDGQNPTITDLEDGVYNVELTVVNECGQTTEEFTVDIYTPVTAAFNLSNTNICEGDVVSFTSTASDNSTDLSWIFEGGSPMTSMMINPTVTYMDEGVYDVSLTASNAQYSDQITQEDVITVQGAAQANFSFTEAGDGYQFSSTSVNAQSYYWDFGDGNISTIMNPTHEYDQDGEYVVTLTVSNNCGGDTHSITLNTYGGVFANIVGESISGCTPLEITLESGSSGTIEGYLWEVTGPEMYTSTEANPSFILSETGVYDVMLKVYNAEFQDSVTIEGFIEVYNLPESGFTFDSEGYTYSFTANAQGAASYTWNFGDGNTSAEANPSHTYTEEGDYEVTLVVSNSCGDVSEVQSISIQSSPTASFTSDMTSGCAPLTVAYTSTSSNAVSYSWTFEGGNPSQSDDENPVVEYVTSGVYAVSLTVTNGVGSDQIMEESYMEVLASPEEDFTVSSDGLTVMINYGGDATGLVWDLGNGNMINSLDDFTIEYEEEGEYTITLTGTNACGDFTIMKTLVLRSSSTEENFKDDILLYPNPAQDEVVLSSTAGFKDYDRVIMYNNIGQVLIEEMVSKNQIEDDKLSLNISEYDAGTYIILLKGSNENKRYRLIIL